LPRLLDTLLKFALFSVCDLKDEKLIKKSKPTRKLKHANSILETFEYFCQISSKSIVTISSYTVSKLGPFLRHSVFTRYCDTYPQLQHCATVAETSRDLYMNCNAVICMA